MNIDWSKLIPDDGEVDDTLPLGLTAEQLQGYTAMVQLYRFITAGGATPDEAERLVAAIFRASR